MQADAEQYKESAEQVLTLVGDSVESAPKPVCLAWGTGL